MAIEYAKIYMLRRLLNFPILIITNAAAIFGILIWFISDSARAVSFDKVVFYQTEEVLRYNLSKISFYDPFVLLNPHLRPIPGVINSLFMHILPLGMNSMRILNSLFSIEILFVTYRITKKLGFSKIGSGVALLLALSFPDYFLSSVSTLAEIMFTFFLMSAILFLYEKKYFLSCINIACLPVIRQEGIIFLLAWLFFCHREKRLNIAHLFYRL